MPDLLPGQMKVKDLNGFDPNDGSKLLGHPDGKIDAADRIYLGSTDPKVIIGFGNMFEYKNFDLNIFFYGMFGQYVANSNRAKYGPSGCEYILQRQTIRKKYWNGGHPTIPRTNFHRDFTVPTTEEMTGCSKKYRSYVVKHNTGILFPAQVDTQSLFTSQNIRRC